MHFARKTVAVCYVMRQIYIFFIILNEKIRIRDAKVHILIDFDIICVAVPCVCRFAFSIFPSYFPNRM